MKHDPLAVALVVIGAAAALVSAYACYHLFFSTLLEGVI